MLYKQYSTKYSPAVVVVTEGGPTCIADETPLIQIEEITGTIEGNVAADHLKRKVAVLVDVGAVV